MIELNMNDVFLVIKRDIYANKVYVEIRDIYTDVSIEDVKKLRKKIDNLDKKYDKGKERETNYFLIQGTDFEVEYNR